MKILFVCTGNSCRSIMARAYLEKRLADLGIDKVSMSSAGTAPCPGMPASDEAKQVMKEEGCDISSHQARRITELDIKEADLIFVMERHHRDFILKTHPAAAKKTYLLKGFKAIGNTDAPEDSDIADPIAKDMAFYKETFKVIKDSVERIIGEIR